MTVGKNNMIARRAEEMAPFMVMEVLERARVMERQGVDIIHLEVGEPDFDVPTAVKKATIRALEEGATHYTHSMGDLDLREAICRHYLDAYGVDVRPEQVVVTSGTSPAMMLAFAALLESGDEVIISDPGYACYPNFINFLGAVPARVPVFEQDGFQLTVKAIQERISQKTKAMLINSPSNPTGCLISAADMKDVSGLSPYIISDEIYHGLVYEGQEHSILEFSDRAFVLNGFSKLYAMTGYRLGYLIAPPQFIRPIQKMQQNFFICAGSLAQRAGIAALEESGDEVKEMKSIYNRRRKFMIKRLKELGLSVAVEPTGAFYVFANARKFSGDSCHLAFDILEKAHVGVTPGVDFGKNGEGYLRFSYANSMDKIAEGLNRLERYLKGL